MGALLETPEIRARVAAHGRPLVTRAIRAAIEEARSSLRAGQPAAVRPDDIDRALARFLAPSLRPVHNATGVVLHTNLGRAPLAEPAQAAVQAVAAGYSNLEFDLAAGDRGDRHVHAGRLVAELFGADGGLVFNNCAGATFLMLAALCRGREVIVARGELVEIGGGFRIPDVMRESGATLVEVGTTNKVYAHDYAAAITERTAAILRVHRSNFAVVGFTHEPSIAELAEVAHAHDVMLLADQGSGLLATEAELGPAAGQVATEPRPKAVLQEGADLVCFSGDKLLGGPQAGILAGRAELLARTKKHPLARAMRADKMTLAALEATLRLYRDGQAHRIPAIAAMAATPAQLELRARGLAQAIRQAAPDLAVEVADGDSVPGGGALPLARLPSRLVLVGEAGPEARALAHALRHHDPVPVVTRLVDDRVALDVRTLPDDVLADVAAAVGEVAPHVRVDPSRGGVG